MVSTLESWPTKMDSCLFVCCSKHLLRFFFSSQIASFDWLRYLSLVFWFLLHSEARENKLFCLRCWLKYVNNLCTRRCFLLPLRYSFVLFINFHNTLISMFSSCHVSSLAMVPLNVSIQKKKTEKRLRLRMCHHQTKNRFFRLISTALLRASLL